MTKNQNLNLIWEKAYCGKGGIYKSSKKLVLTPTLLKRLAISKMTDVTLISADFQDNCVLFSPHVCLLLDFSSRLEFFGAYVADTSEEKNTNDKIDELPSLCIRKCFWSKSEDIEKIQLAEDKEEYILGEKQTLSNIIFLNSAKFPEVVQLMAEAIQLARHGIGFQEQHRSNAFYYEVNLDVTDNGFCCNFAYNPYRLTNSVLEAWIVKWHKCIGNLPHDIGYVPDDKFRMSYKLSLFDQVSKFGNVQA